MLVSEYQPEWDAETLAQAKEIQMDPQRFEKAKIAAQKLADQEAKKAKTMQSVASGVKGSNKVVTAKAMPDLLRPAVAPVNPFNVFQKI